MGPRVVIGAALLTAGVAILALPESVARPRPGARPAMRPVMRPVPRRVPRMSPIRTLPKSPMAAPEIYPEHNLFVQHLKLMNTLRYLRAEDQLTHLGIEYYE